MQMKAQIVLILSLIAISGCSVKTEYVRTKCPTLKHQKDMEHFVIHINKDGGLDANNTKLLISKYKKLLKKFNICNSETKRLYEFNKNNGLIL